MSSGPSLQRSRLDRAQVVRAAITYADAHGLEALSMRRLADALGVTPMALYKHVKSRDDLIDQMVDQLLAGEMRSTPDTAWRTALRQRILSVRSLLNQHPWARGAIETRTTASPAVLAHMDALMEIMFGGGFSPDLIHHAMHALSTRMWGFTRDVLPMPTLPDDADERAAAMRGFAQQYPALVRMATSASHAGDECDADEEFRFALDILLDAFDRLHRTGWTPAASHSR